MKIVEVNTYTVRPRWGFVEIVTDEGLTGWGEPVLEGHCATVLACVQEMKPYLIGKDPMRIEDFSAVLYRAGFYRGGGVLMSAIAGIDQALWDIKGKFLVSYNDCPEIREIWDKPNIHIEEISRLNNLAQRYDGACQYAELLISNYDTSERVKAACQLSLFDDETILEV